ncbi:hypothetical protein F6476_29370 [Pseudomonas umsongensis]|uniref:Uncharacterized protein n=1 Tax=Pseudomonas umsongensis TaxID=198618 RepID=A0ABX4DUR9_9PSED|nr:hypothetical protein [Pseudomonas umsongensis]OXR31883.1 hypothetical protein PSUM_18375 [Pseudomonas umsongensis]QFG34134.1 hypothetical protein F6476_29370 [Pseudomonas umsongensis]
MYPGEKWQGREQPGADPHGKKAVTAEQPLGTMLRGRYASICTPLNTHSCDVKRSQDDHELFESSVDDQSCPD